MSDGQRFPGTPIEGPDDDVSKDSGGIGMPTGPTTGIQTYDLEGARVKKPRTKKRKAKVVKDECMDEDKGVAKEESANAPYDDFDDTDDTASKSPPVDITKFEQPALEKFYNDHKSFFDSEELVKGVCDVASLGNLISQLSFMADSQAVERAIEGDQSKIPEEIRAKAAELLSVLSSMAAEESSEITNGTTAEDVMRQTQPTMAPGLYRADISTFAKSLRDSLGLAKRGARNSAKDLQTIQKVHDASCELGAACNPQTKVDKHEDSDMKKTDAIMTEGNKRGAAVTDPSPGTNSDNADWTDESSDQGQEKQPDPYATKKGKKRSDMDMDMAAKGKKRADMDDNDDDDWDDDDSDDDDDDDSPKTKKRAKKMFSESDLAKAVAAGVKAAFAEMNGGTVAKGTEMTIPRVPPKLMAIGKGGDVSQPVEINVEELKKSVSAVQGRSTQIGGDNDTARLIKAIHAAGPTFRLNPNDIPSA